jgi:cytochrome c5
MMLLTPSRVVCLELFFWLTSYVYSVVVAGDSVVQQQEQEWNHVRETMALLSTTSSTTWTSSSSSSLPRCALASTPFALTSFTSFQVSSLLQTKTLNRLGTIFQDLYNHQQPACDSSHRWISSIQVSSPTTATTQPLTSATQSQQQQQQQFKPQQVSLRYEIKGFYCQTCHGGGAMASLFADRATNNPQRRTHQEDMIFETDYSMRQVNVDNNNNDVIRRIGTRGGTKKPVTNSSNTNKKKKKKKPKPPVPVKDPCTACNSSIPFITESRFQELYAVAIEKAIVNGTIQGIDGMGGFVEVQSIACVATVSNFSSTVFMEFSGDPSAVSGPEVRALEGGFGGTYNDLQGLFCDDQQRKVGNTAFQLISARRLQQRRTATTSSSFQLRVSYRVDVNGTCRGCAKRNTKLFGNDAVKRKLGASVSSYPIHWRNLADSSCTCTSDSIEMNGIRAPAEGEFVVAYNDTVTDLAEQGILKNVGGVTGASQATTVDCPAKLDKFTVTTFVTLSGNPSLIELREVLLLESGKILD